MLDLLEKTRQGLFNFNQKHQLFNKEDKILLAVSGGMDSMVMLELFNHTKYSIAVAHCNYGLRGDASELDEELVASYCKTNQIPFHVKKFDTKSAMESLGKGLQETARIVRYEWFNELAMEHQYTKIATAHHINDNVETFLFNFMRSAGIKGLKGILPLRDRIIRPLLYLTRAEIQDYVHAANLAFREDESNASDAYARNRIRHSIIPALEVYDPQAVKNANRSISHLQETFEFINTYLNQERKQCMTEKAGQILIHKENIKQHFASNILLKELLRPYRFRARTCQSIFESWKMTGAMYKNSRFHLLVDRDYLIIEAVHTDSIHAEINQEDTLVKTPFGKLYLELNPVQINFERGNPIQYLNADALEFPLTLRAWKTGDKFQPFGMKGKHQNLREFLINHKVNRLDKKKIPIMESGGKIACILGFRIDERFRLPEPRGKVLGVKWVVNEE